MSSPLPDIMIMDDDGIDPAVQEAELNRLAGQMRQLDQERKTFCEESERLRKRQKLVLNSLEFEKNDLDTILRVSKADTQMKIDRRNKRTLLELRDALDYFNQRADDEQKKLHLLESEIQEAEKNLLEQQKHVARKDPYHNDLLTKNRIRLLENILHNWTRRVNNQLAINATCRQELSALRAEKAINHKLFKQCETKLQELHKELSSVIRKSLRSYEKGDENTIKIAVLRERDRRDQERHLMDMRDLYRTIEHDQRLKEFMVAKANERQELREEENQKRKKLEKILCRKDNEQKAEIELYENAIEEVKRMTGETDLDKIVLDIEKQDEENFALFNFINDLSEEVEVLQDTIKAKREEINIYENGDRDNENRRRIALKDMEVEIEKLTAETEANNARTEQLNEMIDKLRVGVGSLFDALECDRSAIDCMLGMPKKLSEKHILMFMGLIEHRTNELLQLQQYVELKEQCGGTRLQAEGDGLDHGTKMRRFSGYTLGASYNVNTPNIWDEEDHPHPDIYTLRPMTRDELRAHAIKKLQAPAAGTGARKTVA